MTQSKLLLMYKIRVSSEAPKQEETTMVIPNHMLPGRKKEPVAKKKAKAPAPESASRPPPEDPMKNRPKKEDEVVVEDSPKPE